MKGPWPAFAAVVLVMAALAFYFRPGASPSLEEAEIGGSIESSLMLSFLDEHEDDSGDSEDAEVEDLLLLANGDL